MIKREIKEFKLYCDGVADYPVTVPFSLYSAMCDLGRLERINTDVNTPLPENARVCATFVADESFFNGRYSYIRIFDVETECKVYLNKTLVGSLDGIRRKYILDVASVLVMGENTIEFVFEKPSWNSGLIRNIEFLKFNSAIIDNVRVLQRHEEGAVSLDVFVDVIGDAENTRAVATLISGAGQIYYGGFNRGKATVTVRDPLYWWPKGLGIQNVYKLSVNLYGEMEAEDSAEFKVGLCTVLPNEDSLGVLLDVNGVPLIPMGAVYTPEKNYLPAESRKRTAAFVTSAAMAGFNSFIIKSDEKLPSNEFFDLCDVHGIAVICQVGGFDDSLIDTISRMAHHPSFAPLDLIGMSAEDRLVFEEKLSEKAPGLRCSGFDADTVYFGESSIPCDKTTFATVDKVDRNVFSDKMEECSAGACRDMATSVSENYLYAFSTSDFAYLTRLSQAEKTKKKMLEARLGCGKTGRAVFSSLNAERLISDSSLDPGASWKALQYSAVKFFSVALVWADTSGTSVTFNASNAGKTAVFGTLEYRVIDTNNSLIYKNSADIDIGEHSSRQLFTIDLSEHIASHECDRYIEYIFSEGSHQICRGVALFVPPKRFDFQKADIKTEISGADKRFSITLSADKYVGALELSFEDVDAVFSDNYLDVTSPMPIKINVTVNSPIETVKTLKKQLKVRSLYDIGK